MDDSDKTDNTDKLVGMAAIVKKSPVFRLWKSGNPNSRITCYKLTYRHVSVSKNGLTIADDYREHWIQHITFAAETNAADTDTA